MDPNLASTIDVPVPVVVVTGSGARIAVEVDSERTMTTDAAGLVARGTVIPLRETTTTVEVMSTRIRTVTEVDSNGEDVTAETRKTTTKWTTNTMTPWTLPDSAVVVEISRIHAVLRIRRIKRDGSIVRTLTEAEMWETRRPCMMSHRNLTITSMRMRVA